MMNKNSFSAFLRLLLIAVSTPFSASLTYQEDATNFPNPERGYFVVQLNKSNLQSARNKGITLVRKYYRLDPYVNSDILPASVFDEIKRDAELLRQVGVKVIPRFIYNFGACTGAPLTRISAHIDQLGPVLRANSDVIAFIEAGFIGRWGEWHFSECADNNPYRLNEPLARNTVLNKLIAAVPDRMVALRYNFNKREILGETPLGPDLAFTNTNAARVGAHNDCFVAGTDDMGTYQGSQSTEWQKSWLSQDNRFVPQGGETCATSQFSGCASSLADFKRMHWDAINSEFQGSVIKGWESGGCNEEVKKSLGYRLKLTSAQLPDGVRPGSPFTGTIRLVNVGWGKIFNYRGCELVFRNTQTKKTFSVSLDSDPRKWSTAWSEAAVNVSAMIPSGTPEGEYNVYLSLPDTASRLHGNPAFSIRLANTGVWEDSTGYNSLQHKVLISTSIPISINGQIRGESRFSVSLLRSNGTYSFSIRTPESGPVSVAIYTPDGSRLLSQELSEVRNHEYAFSWNGPSQPRYLIHLQQGNHSQYFSSGF
jgi:hypothetical protein